MIKNKLNPSEENLLTVHAEIAIKYIFVLENTNNIISNNKINDYDDDEEE